MTLLPKVKLKTVPHFPANIIGGTGLSSTKSNGSITLDFAWQEFGSSSAIPTSPTSYVLTYDTATGVYVMVPSHLLGGAASGIADAPIDGVTYGRNSSNWVVADYPTHAMAVAANIASSNTWLRTTGYSAIADGGGALYARVASAPSHPGKFQSADGAWWELRTSSYILPEQLGAKGDWNGTAGTDDRPALMDAIAYCNAKNCPLRLGPKAYYISNVLDITLPISIEGTAQVSSQIVSGNMGNDIIRITANGASLTGFGLHNFALNYSSESAGGTYGIRVRSLARGVIYFCYFSNIYIQDKCHSGMSIETGFWHLFDKIVVQSVGPDGRGFNFQGTGPETGGAPSSACGDLFMTHCSVIGGTSAFATSGLVIDSWAEGLYIDNCTFENPGLDFGIWIENSQGASYPPRNLFFDTVICDGNRKQGLEIDAGLEVRFVNSWFTTTQAGEGVYITNAASITFTSCMFINNWNQGAYFNSSASQVTFNGCVFDSNSASGLGAQDAIYVDSNTADFMITNCTFYRGIGVTKTHRYSISVANGSSDRYIISNNNLFGYRTSALALGTGHGTNRITTPNIT